MRGKKTQADGFNSWAHTEEKEITQLEGNGIEIIQTERERGKKAKKKIQNKQSLRDPLNNTK